MRWLLLLAAGCGTASQQSIADLKCALIEAAATAAGAALSEIPSANPRESSSSSPPSLDSSKWRWPKWGEASLTACGTATMDCPAARDCMDDRHYWMMRSRVTTQCYFVTSDGRRWDCAPDGSLMVRRGLDDWCGRSRRKPRVYGAQ
jgi:hypothetical protein